MVEYEPEDNTAQERSAGQTNEHPHDGRVEGGGGKSLGQSGSEGVGEEVHGLHEGLHGRGSLGVGVLQTGDRGENLGHTDEDVGGGLDGNVHVVTLGGTVDLGGSAERAAVTGTSGVDQVLHDGGVHHGQGGDDETQSDTGDGAEGNLQAAHQRVDDGLEQGDEHDNGDGIEVLHEIVGDAVALHLTSLSDEVAGELAVDNPVDGVESEDAAGDKGTLELINEVVVPGQSGLGVAVLALPAGLGGIHVAVDNHHTESLEGVGDNGSLRGTHNVVLAAEAENQGSDGEHAETQQVAGPETNVLLHVGSGQEGQRTNVDTSVEDHVDTLDGQGRVNDDALALLGGGQSHLLALVLIGNQGSNVTLDTTSSKTNDQDRNDETTQTGTVFQGGRDGSADQNQETDEVNNTEQNDSLVLSEVLISNDSTNDRGN